MFISFPRSFDKTIVFSFDTDLEKQALDTLVSLDLYSLFNKSKRISVDNYDFSPSVVNNETLELIDLFSSNSPDSHFFLDYSVSSSFYENINISLVQSTDEFSPPLFASIPVYSTSLNDFSDFFIECFNLTSDLLSSCSFNSTYLINSGYIIHSKLFFSYNSFSDFSLMGYSSHGIISEQIAILDAHFNLQFLLLKESGDPGASV